VKICIVIPVYNEAANVRPVLAEITSTLLNYQSHDYRIILANDASTDDTAMRIQEYINERGLSGLIHLFENRENIGTAPTMRKLFQIAVDMRPDLVIKLDMDRDFSQGEVLDKFILNIATNKNTRENQVLAGIRTLPKGKAMTFFERVNRKIMDEFLQKTLAVHNYDPVSAGTQMYPIGLLKNLLEEEVVRTFDLRWGMDVLLSMLAKRNGFELITIPILRTKYDRDRRADKKVKLQYQAFYQVFDEVYAQV